MTWKDKLWSTYGLLADISMSISISTLNALGSLSCILCGGGFAFSYVIEEQLSASYYGRALASGNLLINAKFEKWDHRLNYSVPFNETEKIDGALNYKLTDYVNQQTILLASLLCMVGGVVFRLLAKLLEQRQHEQWDNTFYSTHHIRSSALPKANYKFSCLRSLCTSLTYSFNGAAGVASLIQCTSFVGSTQSITYPSDSSVSVKALYYEGPVASLVIPLAYKLAENISLNLSSMDIKIMLDEQINGQINATYAGGLFFKSQARSNPPVAMAFIAGSVAFLASSFFAKKERDQENDRHVKAIEYKPDYNLIL